MKWTQTTQYRWDLQIAVWVERESETESWDVCCIYEVII